MQAYAMSLKSANFADLSIGVSSLYLLSAPSTPDDDGATQRSQVFVLPSLLRQRDRPVDQRLDLGKPPRR